MTRNEAMPQSILKPAFSEVAETLKNGLRGGRRLRVLGGGRKAIGHVQKTLIERTQSLGGGDRSSN